MFNLKNIILTGCITMTLGNAPCSVRNYFTPVPVQSPAFDQMFELTFKHFDITNENEDFKLYEVSDQESLEANVAHYMSDIIKNKWFLGNDGPILNEKLEKKFTLEWIKDSVAFLWRTQGFFTPLDSFNPQSDGTSQAERGLKKFAFWDKSDEKVAAVAVRKLIVKPLVAKMFKPFDPYRPLVEVARKMKAIEGMQPQINDMERRIRLMQAVDGPVVERTVKYIDREINAPPVTGTTNYVKEDFPNETKVDKQKNPARRLQPLVEVARKFKAIEGMQPQIWDMERRIRVMQYVEPVLDDAITLLKKTVNVGGMGRRRRLKRLDDGQPLVEVARKMKAIEGMQPQINDMERRIGYLHAAEPVLEDAIKSLQQVVDVRGMGHRRLGASKEYLEMPAIQVARKMKDIEGMQPQINDMERRLGIMQSVIPVLEDAAKTLRAIITPFPPKETGVDDWGRKNADKPHFQAVSLKNKRALRQQLSHSEKITLAKEISPKIHKLLAAHHNVLKSTPSKALEFPDEIAVIIPETTTRIPMKECTEDNDPEFCFVIGTKLADSVTAKTLNKPEAPVNYIRQKGVDYPLDKCPIDIASKYWIKYPWKRTSDLMRLIQHYQDAINDMERRLQDMQSFEPLLENAIKTLQKVVDVRGMGRRRLLDKKMLMSEKIGLLLSGLDAAGLSVTDQALLKCEPAYPNVLTVPLRRRLDGEFFDREAFFKKWHDAENPTPGYVYVLPDRFKEDTDWVAWYKERFPGKPLPDDFLERIEREILDLPYIKGKDIDEDGLDKDGNRYKFDLSDDNSKLYVDEDPDAKYDEPPVLMDLYCKMRALERMQTVVNDLERRLGLMQSVEPVLENAIKTMQKVVDVRGMG